MKIWQQITKETWCKGANIRTVLDAPCQRCAIGWLQYAYMDDMNKFYDFAYGIHKNDLIGIVHWNDDPCRSYEDVYNVFKSLDL